MSLPMKMILNPIGLLLGVIAAVCLYYGSQETPYQLDTWNREAEPEQRFRRRRGQFARVGFILLGLSFVCQLVALFL